MTNRKIEGDRLAEAIETFRQRASEQFPSPDVGVTEPIASAVGNTDSTNAPAVDHRGPVAAVPSLRQAIAEFVMPKITHPGLLHGSRTASILEQLVNDILPMLEGSDELRALASTVVEDEMGRHREVTSRIHAGLAA